MLQNLKKKYIYKKTRKNPKILNMSKLVKQSGNLEEEEK